MMVVWLGPQWRLGLGHILKVEVAGVADGFDVRERGVKDESQDIDL